MMHNWKAGLTVKFFLFSSSSLFSVFGFSLLVLIVCSDDESGGVCFNLAFSEKRGWMNLLYVVNPLLEHKRQLWLQTLVNPVCAAESGIWSWTPAPTRIVATYWL